MKCFTSSGFSRLACLLIKLGTFEVKCIVYSLALLSFISISTFRKRAGCGVHSEVVGLREIVAGVLAENRRSRRVAFREQ